MEIIEIFDNDTKYVPAVRVKQGNHTYVREDLVDKVLLEKDKEIKELKTRISELEDKDWYEKCIKQLEEQNNNLIKERDELAFEKRNTFGLIEKMQIKLAEVTEEKIQEIRKQVCDEIKREIANLENIELSSYMTLCDIIDKIEQPKENM